MRAGVVGVAVLLAASASGVEPAKLDRNRFIVEANSWQTGGTVIVKTPDCAGSTQKVVQSVVRDFVEHYRAMNPAQGSK